MSSGNIALRKLATGSGVLAVALVDVESGRCLFAASAPNAPDMDLRRAARHNASILRSHLELAVELQLSDEIEDVLTTMGRQYHLIRFVPKREYAGLFLYLVADREQANLALARRELRETAAELSLSPGEKGIYERLRQGSGSADAPTTGRQYAWSRGDMLGTNATDSDDADMAEVAEEDLPPFMRTDSVLRLLGITTETAPPANATEATSPDTFATATGTADSTGH